MDELTTTRLFTVGHLKLLLSIGQTEPASVHRYAFSGEANTQGCTFAGSERRVQAPGSGHYARAVHQPLATRTVRQTPAPASSSPPAPPPRPMDQERTGRTGPGHDSGQGTRLGAGAQRATQLGSGSGPRPAARCRAAGPTPSDPRWPARPAPARPPPEPRGSPAARSSSISANTLAVDRPPRPTASAVERVAGQHRGQLFTAAGSQRGAAVQGERHITAQLRGQHADRAGYPLLPGALMATSTAARRLPPAIPGGGGSPSRW